MAKYTFRKAGPNLELIGDKPGSKDSMQHAIADLPEVKARVRMKAAVGGSRSEARLASVKNRNGGGIPSISEPAEVNVSSGPSGIDWYVELIHQNALSIEFGRPKKGGWGAMKPVGILLAAFDTYGTNDGEEYD